jgi:hypothetical protein
MTEKDILTLPTAEAAAGTPARRKKKPLRKTSAALPEAALPRPVPAPVESDTLYPDQAEKIRPFHPTTPEEAPQPAKVVLPSPEVVEKVVTARDEQLQSPAPADTAKKVPRPAPTKPAQDTSATGPTDAEINQKWDTFLLSLNRATLIAVYEMGKIKALSDFRAVHKSDLMRPRGRLTPAQADEVESKLLILGVKLSAVPSSPEARTAGPQVRISAMRNLTPTEPLPEDASSQQRRQHRMSRNRLAM